MDETNEPIDSFQIGRFAEPATFMRAPLTKDLDEIDIGLVGVPFDFPTNRGGPRHAPAQVREMSRLIRRYNSAGTYSPFDLCRIADIGDAPFNPLNPQGSVALLADYFRNLADHGIAPVACGGDHGATYPILKGLVRDESLAIVHIDAHPDTYHEIYGDKYNHGTLLSRAVEEELVDPAKVVSIGLRGTRFALDDRAFNEKYGMRIITMDEYEQMGRSGVVEEMHRIIGGSPVYVTFDVDALDPVHAPGTGSPEPGGLSFRDAQVLLRSLEGFDVVGGDVCEVSPPLDPSGITALSGANLMFEILCITAKAVATRQQRQ